MTALVGDLVSFSAWEVTHSPMESRTLVGEVVRQTDIMSEVVTAHGLLTLRTIKLTVVQPGHVGTDTHTGQWRQR